MASALASVIFAESLVLKTVIIRHELLIKPNQLILRNFVNDFTKFSFK